MLPQFRFFVDLVAARSLDGKNMLLTNLVASKGGDAVQKKGGRNRTKQASPQKGSYNGNLAGKESEAKLTGDRSECTRCKSC